MNTNFLTQAQVGNIATNKVAEARKAINERWEISVLPKVCLDILKIICLSFSKTKQLHC